MEFHFLIKHIKIFIKKKKRKRKEWSKFTWTAALWRLRFLFGMRCDWQGRNWSNWVIPTPGIWRGVTCTCWGRGVTRVWVAFVVLVPLLLINKKNLNKLIQKYQYRVQMNSWIVRFKFPLQHKKIYSQVKYWKEVQVKYSEGDNSDKI